MIARGPSSPVDQEIANVLTDLAHKARVQLSIEPGVLQLLPAEIRSSFNLQMSDATIAQALEVISGATGLVFTRTTEGIMVEPSKTLSNPTTGPTTRPRASFMLRTTVPGPNGTSVDMIIRSDELPDDLRAALEAHKAKFIEGLRAKMVKNPTTQPTTEPAKEPGAEPGAEKAPTTKPTTDTVGRAD